MNTALEWRALLAACPRLQRLTLTRQDHASICAPDNDDNDKEDEDKEEKAAFADNQEDEIGADDLHSEPGISSSLHHRSSSLVPATADTTLTTTLKTLTASKKAFVSLNAPCVTRARLTHVRIRVTPSLAQTSQHSVLLAVDWSVWVTPHLLALDVPALSPEHLALLPRTLRRLRLQCLSGRDPRAAAPLFALPPSLTDLALANYAVNTIEELAALLIVSTESLVEPQTSLLVPTPSSLDTSPIHSTSSTLRLRGLRRLCVSRWHVWSLPDVHLPGGGALAHSASCHSPHSQSRVRAAALTHGVYRALCTLEHLECAIDTSYANLVRALTRSALALVSLALPAQTVCELAVVAPLWLSPWHARVTRLSLQTKETAWYDLREGALESTIFVPCLLWGVRADPAHVAGTYWMTGCPCSTCTNFARPWFAERDLGTHSDVHGAGLPSAFSCASRLVRHDSKRARLAPSGTLSAAANALDTPEANNKRGIAHDTDAVFGSSSSSSTAPCTTLVAWTPAPAPWMSLAWLHLTRLDFTLPRLPALRTLVVGARNTSLAGLKPLTRTWTSLLWACTALERVDLRLYRVDDIVDLARATRLRLRVLRVLSVRNVCQERAAAGTPALGVDGHVREMVHALLDLPQACEFQYEYDPKRAEYWHAVRHAPELATRTLTAMV